MIQFIIYITAWLNEHSNGEESQKIKTENEQKKKCANKIVGTFFLFK